MTFAELVKTIIQLIDNFVAVGSALAVVVFLWGLVRYIYESQDTHSQARGRELIGWGLVALFVMVSMWGILAIMREALNL